MPLVLSVETDIVLQKTQQGLAAMDGLILQAQQAAVGQLEHCVELFEVDIDDGKLGREVAHNGRQGETEAPCQHCAELLGLQLEDDVQAVLRKPVDVPPLLYAVRPDNWSRRWRGRQGA